jgi:hypothetical protein
MSTPDHINNIRETAKQSIIAFCKIYIRKGYTDKYVNIVAGKSSYAEDVIFSPEFDNIGLVNLRLLMLSLHPITNERFFPPFIQVLTSEINASPGLGASDYHSLHDKYESAQKRIAELEQKLSNIQQCMKS